MKRFIQRFADRVTGVLNGFDRLVIRGSLKGIVHTAGMLRFLWENHVYLKDFGEYAHSVTEQVKSASCQKANELNRTILYLESSNSNKEETARKILSEDAIQEGLIGILSCVEFSNSFDVHRNRTAKQLQLVRKGRKCLHLYHYSLHPEFGFMSARIQTWFPFDIQICLNGREWLARQMDKAGIGYRRRENCFAWIDDPEAAQKIMQKQLNLYWPKVLESIARKINPAHNKIFKNLPQQYYWIVYQSEWATISCLKSLLFWLKSIQRLSRMVLHISPAPMFYDSWAVNSKESSQERLSATSKTGRRAFASSIEPATTQ